MTVDAARAVWREVFAGFDTPTVVGPPDRFGLGPRGVAAFLVPEEITQALSELARSRHTTVSTVLQAAWAQLLMGLTGRHDVAFGAVVSERPAEVPGADSMVGLLINTVPVRANITPATTVADLLDQLQSAHNHTLEHQHLALSEIHRLTGHQRLFDTVFVYENYPADAAALSGIDGLAITEITNRDYYHYPLTVQAVPGNELDLHVQYRADVFDVADIETLIERFKRVLVAMTADPTRPLSSIDVLDEGKHARPDGWGNRAVPAQPATTAVSAPEYRKRWSRPGYPGRANPGRHLRSGAGGRPRRDRRVVFRPGRRFAFRDADGRRDQRSPGHRTRRAHPVRRALREELEPTVGRTCRLGGRSSRRESGQRSVRPRRRHRG